MSYNRDLIERMAALGAHLVLVKRGVKAPVHRRWTMSPAISVDEAVAHVAAGGNLGANQALSRIVVLDAEDEAATHALRRAGFELTVATAKAQDPKSPKYGGSHVWLRVPDHIDSAALPSNRTGIVLPGGGKIDALAGARQMVVPPSAIDEAPGHNYAPYAGGLLDLDTELRSIPVAPDWLFDRATPAPAGLEPLAGILIPDPPSDRVEVDARSIELTERIDAVGWADWLDGDRRLTPTGQYDGCGCPIYHWQGADNEKSATLHDGCSQGCGVHVWSGTMMAQLGLPGDHVSRLDLACALRGQERRAVAASVGIVLGREREPLAPLTPAYYEQQARELEAAGDSVRAAEYRATAAAMAAQMHAPVLPPGEVVTTGRVAGAPVTSGATALADAAGTGDLQPGSAVVVHSGGLPAVDPLLPQHIARAERELVAPPAEIDTGAYLCRDLLPADTRSLADAVFGPRATPAPADVEASHALLAQAVAAAVGGTKLIHAADAETWYGWDGNRWRSDVTAAAVAVQGLLHRRQQCPDPAQRQRKIRAWSWKKLTAEQRSRFAAVEGYTLDEYGALVDAKTGTVIEMLATPADVANETTTVRNAIIAQLGADPDVVVRTEDLDADPAVVGVAGGYLRLGGPKAVRTGEAAAVTITPVDPSARVTKLMGATHDAAAQCPLWDQALADALPDLEVRRWLQRALGQALFGRQDEHLLIVMEGLGGNGKGLVMEVLTAVFGGYAAVLQTSVITLAGMNNHATDLMPLKGARLATVDEVPPQQLNLDLVKKITGGGPLSARLCGQDQVEWKQSHTLLMTTNNKLQWQPSAMAAMRRRLRVIKFLVEFGTAGGPALVEGLAEKIIAEEAAGVLNWLVEGYAMYAAEGLNPMPVAVEEWTAATLAGSSSWASFCDIMFEVTRDDSDMLTSAEVFGLWDYFRSEDTDQRHASPGSTRVVSAMVCEQLKGVSRIEAKGKTKAGVRGVRWSADGREWLADMQKSRGGGVPFVSTPVPPSPRPVTPQTLGSVPVIGSVAG